MVVFSSYQLRYWMIKYDEQIKFNKSYEQIVTAIAIACPDGMNGCFGEIWLSQRLL
jgi:hypothetical protein